MKFAILKERKNPPDKRVIFSPQACNYLKATFSDLDVIVESSDDRIFVNEEYKEAGIKVTDNISDCDVLLGVKEVPVDNLIQNKKYFFFSHTIKKQPYNRKLLQAILHKNIELYDHETIVDERGFRLIGFGYYAGIVGAYNGLRTYGLKYDLLASTNNILMLLDLDLRYATILSNILNALIGGVAAKRSSFAPVLISFATNLDL